MGNCTSGNLEIPLMCNCTSWVWSFGPSRDDISLIFIAALNPARPSHDYSKLSSTTEETAPMKIALLVLLGLVLGAVGGAALAIGAGLAWVEIFKPTSSEGYNGMLVFFTFMPLGAAIGGLRGALLFGVIAIGDAEIAIGQQPARRRDR